LNEWADVGAFQTITKKINGGLNGYDSRLRYWKRAIAALEPIGNPQAGGD
jgi:putative chitinase